MRLPLPGKNILAPGVVLELLVPVNPEPKYKFCFFCAADDPPLYFLINSVIGPYIATRPHLMEQQVLVPKSELDNRLKRDSWLDCSNTFSNFSHEEICTSIENDRDCYMGRLSDDVLIAVVQVVKKSMTIRPIEQYAILDALPDIE